MNDLRYIFAKPIDINIGTIYPLNILDYTINIHKFNVLAMNRNSLLQAYDIKTQKEDRDWIEQNIKDFDVICMNPQYIKSVIELFEIVFKKNSEEINSNYIEIYTQINQDIESNKIKQEDLNDIKIILPYLEKIFILVGDIPIYRDNYTYVKNQICKINSVHLPRQYKTKKLQERMDLARSRQSQGNDQDYEDIITTLAIVGHYDLEKLENKTVYQINALINRANKVKEFDCNIQYICAGAEKVKLESFTTHIDVNENKEKLSSDYYAENERVKSLLKTK
jgi:hypothetical protein